MFCSVFLAFTRITLINNNIDNDDQVTLTLPIQFFSNQFKCMTHEKFRNFFRKVATPDRHLTFL